MIIIKVIHVCDICERRAMQRLTITSDFQNINEAVKNVEYNQGLFPQGWNIITNGETQELQCPTCRQNISIKEFDDKLKAISEGKLKKKLKAKLDKQNGQKSTDNDSTCMTFFT